MLLLEMLIAFSLMVGVIAVLMYGLFDAIQAKNRVKKDREQIITEQRLRLRFQLLFKDATDIKRISDNNYYIRYKGGIDPDPHFRNEVEALLELKNNILTLTSYPPEEAARRELLCEHILSIEVLLFDEQAEEFLPTFPKHKPRLMKVKVSGKELPLFL